MNEDTGSDQNCKGCSANVRISPEEIAALFNPNLRIKAVKVVTEAEYADRIDACLACPALQYGTTCMHCGCLVHLKAKLRVSKCPFPYAPRWEKLASLSV
ncbi:hypothetical protein EHS13_14795 [Paenibacillus psychroresistens]|uniref:Uncharacterized protein n=1 Tax=Paenibacillus psychroresistens TaxID=1778678 RepID=A0A6B8RKH4_9BACL|nr:hypothetical protein [Paenibacillus psychroresistens]QGQ96053.1 hypothetical protein EHS13_14795 [Paenibacillus psychroresistens]